MSDQSLEVKGGERLSVKAMQEMIRPYAVEAIRTAVQLLKSPNDNIRLGASKLLLAKVLPDLKSSELTGVDGQPLRIIIQDYATVLKPIDDHPTTEAEVSDSAIGDLPADIHGRIEGRGEELRDPSQRSDTEDATPQLQGFDRPQDISGTSSESHSRILPGVSPNDQLVQSE